jgi:DNA-binding transcriptional LysR family regulator
LFLHCQKRIRRSATAAHADDLASHNCIQYRLGTKGPLAKWHFEWKGQAREIAVAGRLTLNGADLAVRAALDGIGIAYVPEELAAPFLRTGQLTRALESWSAAIEGLFLFYPGGGRFRRRCGRSSTWSAPQSQSRWDVRSRVPSEP